MAPEAASKSTNQTVEHASPADMLEGRKEGGKEGGRGFNKGGSCGDGVFFFYQHGGILIQKAADAFTPTANWQPDRV